MSTTPAELREAAGKEAHARRCRQAGPDHAPKDCPFRLHKWGVFCCDRCGAAKTGRRRPEPCQVCQTCDPLLADWPDLTDDQRETFRASQDPALSVVAPLLAECAAALPGTRVQLLARLAALGVRP